MVILLEVNGRKTPNYLLALEILLYHFLAVPMGERTTHIVTVVIVISCSSSSAFQYDVFVDVLCRLATAAECRTLLMLLVVILLEVLFLL